MGTYLSVKSGSVENLRATYRRATPEEIEQGKRWYAVANQRARTLAEEHDLPLATVAQVIAALSPRRRWAQNLADAGKVIAAWRQDPNDPYRPRIALPAGRRPLKRAYDILNGGQVTGPKCRGFAETIADPAQEACLVVDTHVAHAWAGKLHGDSATISIGLYRRICQALRQLAAETGLTASQVQAIIWLVTKRLKVERKRGKTWQTTT